MLRPRSGWSRHHSIFATTPTSSLWSFWRLSLPKHLPFSTTTTATPKKPEIRNVRGMHDLFGLDAHLHAWIQQQATHTVSLFDYHKMDSPLLEYSHVFERSLGDTTDVVSKELYQFRDKSDQSVTLRPEGTAGILISAVLRVQDGGRTGLGTVRAFLAHHLYRSLPQRFFYHGAMFRYEHPQKGRLRQFDQFGVESFGLADPLADVESILMAWQFLDHLGISDSLRIKVNSIGDTTSRHAYKETLRSYFLLHRDQLSTESQERLLRTDRDSVWRILDSKEPQDQRVLQRADFPTMQQHMSAASRDRFEAVCRGLALHGVPFDKDPCLVRGLDYYQHTVFEMVYTSTTAGKETASVLGSSQGTVLAGGRYDGLVETLASSEKALLNGANADPIPCFGWACGMHRLALLLAHRGPSNPAWQNYAKSNISSPVLLVLVPPVPSASSSLDATEVKESLRGYAMQLMHQLRQMGIATQSTLTEMAANTTTTIPPASKQLQKLVKRYHPAGDPRSPTGLGSMSKLHQENPALATQWFEAVRPMPRWALFVGEQECREETVTIKDLQTSTQQICKCKELAQFSWNLGGKE